MGLSVSLLGDDLYRHARTAALLYLNRLVAVRGRLRLLPASKMATNILETQHEKAFQNQSNVFLASKKVIGGKKTRPSRWFKDAGLGFVAPKEAREGNYIDRKCPFTGDVSIRGRILKAMVVSAKMKRTIIIRRHYLHYVQKYNRYEKRHTNLAVHCSPCFDVKEGDIVTVGQCRPLSKTVRFNVLKVEKNQIFGTAKKQFRMF